MACSPGCDIVLDGLDSARSRRTLSAACARLGLPLVLGAVDGWLCHAALSMPGDGLTERLYPAGTADADAAAAPVGTLRLPGPLCLRSGRALRRVPLRQRRRERQALLL